MKISGTHILTIALIFLLPVSIMAEVKQFDSIAGIEAQHKGVPWLLVIWSTDCPPCYVELDMLSRLENRGEDIKVEYLSFDPASKRDDVFRVSDSFPIDTWFSNEPNREKLQMLIDVNWRGELPRSYWYQADGTRCSQSGILNEQAVLKWFNQVAPDCGKMD